MQIDEIKTLGSHKISCASIESPVVDKMLQGTKAKLLYSDPPWGDGNLKYWVTMNKKMTGNEFSPLSYRQLLDRIYEIIDKYVEGHIMIETGPRWVDALLADLGAKYFNARSIKLEYSGGLPCFLVYASTSPDVNYTGVPVNKTGQKVVSELVGAVTNPGDVVIDPCCGMGYTAQACLNSGALFRGNEFNVKRIEKTIKRFN